MQEELYILSSHHLIMEGSELDKDTIPDDPIANEILDGKKFILQERGKWLIIPMVIKEFLCKFETPNSLEAVIEDFALEANCKKEQIRPTLEKFFQNMKKRKILKNAADPEEQDDWEWHSALEINSVFLNYKIEDIIYLKKQTEIYKATNSSDGKTYILKILNLNNIFSEKRKKRLLQLFTQELCIHKSVLGHPNICEIVNDGQTETCMYSIIDFVDGGNVRDFVMTQHPNLEKRLAMVGQILSSMSWVHEKGVTHGDLHISNFLITSEGAIKLIDFDLSNRVDLDDDEIVREGGVFQYIPPEKVHPDPFEVVTERADFRSEVYQLGVIVYFLLYESMPFNAFIWKNLAEMIKSFSPVFAEQSCTGEEIPEDIINMMKCALAKDPKDRYSSASEMYLTFLSYQSISS